MNVWRDRLHRWFAPAAARCPLSPNAITAIALAMNAGAALCLAEGSNHPALFLAAIALVTVAGLADAFDGIVARTQNKQSRYGDFLDHFADRVSDTLLITGWLLGNGVRTPLAIGVIILVMLNGYTGTQIEATWQKRSYDSLGRGEFVLALVVFPIVSFILASNGWSHLSGSGLMIAEWMSVALALVALLGVGQRLRLASTLDRRE